MDISKYIENNYLKVLVKPNAKKTELISYDSNKKALRIAIAAVPDKNKANKELLHFLSKLLKKKVIIVSGLKSRKKVLQIY